MKIYKQTIVFTLSKNNANPISYHAIFEGKNMALAADERKFSWRIKKAYFDYIASNGLRVNEVPLYLKNLDKTDIESRIPLSYQEYGVIEALVYSSSKQQNPGCFSRFSQYRIR